MLLDIINIDEFIKTYDCGEVKSAQYFEPNSSLPKDDGLISNEIFGLAGTDERKKRFGYISLNDVFMHPHVLNVFRRLKKNIADDMISGTNRYYVNSEKELEKINPDKPLPVPESEIGVGFKWLKEVWDKLDWKPKKDDTKGGSDRKLFLDSLSVDEIFIDKFLVIPAYYRDANLKNFKKNEINADYYEKMIGLADMVKNTDSLFISHSDYSIPTNSVAYVKLQNVIYDCYLYFIDKMTGLKGFIHRYVMGKRTTFGARMVITAPNFNTETAEDGDIDFQHSGLALSTTLNTFSPFIVHGLIRYLKNKIGGSRYVYSYDNKTKELIRNELSPDHMEQYSIDKIKRMLRLYEKSKVFRIEPFTLMDIDKKPIPLFYVMVNDSDDNVVKSATELSEDDLSKYKYVSPMTNLEVLYMIAYNYVRDKHIYITRYPVVDINGTYPSKFNIVPCTKHNKRYVDGVLYPRFPDLTGITIDNVDNFFDDSLKLFTTFLPGLGGDYDGDHVTVQSVFSEEANAAADKQINSLSNVMGINGEMSRSLSPVIFHGLYNFTLKLHEEDNK